ncbi:hypothetical protein C0J52_13938 [Blattella germanica]|nr:hypothetical protein C0J52_13938 [Blattella germanica]
MFRKEYINACYKHAMVSIMGEIGSSHIWTAVNESTNVLGRYVVNFVVGRLSSDGASTLYNIASRILERKDHATVAIFINDGLKVLWPGCVQEEKVLVKYIDSCSLYVESCKNTQSIISPPHPFHMIGSCYP